MRGARRPVRGAISGFFFGFFLGLTLLCFGVLPLKSPWLTILPVAGIVLGAVWGYWVPYGRRPPTPEVTSSLVRPAAPSTPRPIGDQTPPPPTVGPIGDQTPPPPTVGPIGDQTPPPPTA